MPETVERITIGEEAHLTAQHLLDVLVLALLSTARGEWDKAAEFSSTASLLADRLARSR